MGTFTTKDTAFYYDVYNRAYKGIWSPDGNCHWGLFLSDEDTLDQAMKNLTEKMIADLGIKSDHHILDIGCGNGVTVNTIFDKTKCFIGGIDTSKERIYEARQSWAAKVSHKVHFWEGDAENLDVTKNAWNGILSQSVFYHCHNKEKALQEAFDILRKGSKMVVSDVCRFDDRPITENGRKHFYERLMFTPEETFTANEYRAKLEETGFVIKEWTDITPSMQKSYECVVKNNEGRNMSEDSLKLLEKIQYSIEAIQAGDVMHVYYVVEKP